MMLAAADQIRDEAIHEEKRVSIYENTKCKIGRSVTWRERHR